jgi:hypothetical protein
MIYAYLEENVRLLAGLKTEPDFLRTRERYRFCNPQDTFRRRSPRDVQAANYQAAAALAALAILGDPPPIWVQSDPATAPRIEPASNYVPWIGVPVVPFENDTMPPDWLCNGPFRRGTTETAMEPVGGLGRARPEPGLTVLSDGQPVDFRVYRPTHWDATNMVPRSIYARNCNRYWASGTGGGYLPGIRLTRRWRETAGRDVPLDLVLFTVLSNDTERVVQACPNWRSPSYGNRMWLNGREVRDGELYALTPGLYPLTVLVELVGGYSAQSPRLREYTSAMYEQDRQVAAAAGTRSTHERIRRAYLLLVSNVCDYAQADLRPDDAWGFDRVQETVLPLLAAMHRLTDGSMTNVFPAAHVLAPAVQTMGYHDRRAGVFAVAQAGGILPLRHQGVATWFLNQADDVWARPLEVVTFLSGRTGERYAVPPDGTVARASEYPSYGMHVYRSGWTGIRVDRLVLLEDGAGSRCTGLEMGAVALYALGRPWLYPTPGADIARANNLTLEGLLPLQSEKVMSEVRPDGSGSMTVRCRQWVNATQNGREWVRGRQEVGVHLQRAFTVDFRPESGAAVVLVCVDRWEGVGRRQKTWRFDFRVIGKIGPPGQDGATLETVGNQLLFVPRGGMRDWPSAVTGATFRLLCDMPRRMDFQTINHPKSPAVFVEALLDRNPGEAARGALSEKKMTAGVESDALLDSLIEEFDAQQRENTRQSEGPETAVSVMSVSPSRTHPPVSVERGTGETVVIRVGGAIYEYDGLQVRPKPP